MSPSPDMVRKRSDPFDFYETPEWVTNALLNREQFSGGILEPCSGAGAISRVLEGRRFPVESCDVRTEGIYGTGDQDFLRRTQRVDNIITNPPFNQAEAIARHGMKIARKKLCLFLKVNFLEGVGRFDFFRQYPPRRILIFSRRVQMHPAGTKSTGNGCICFAWYVWEIGYRGDTIVRWIRDEHPSTETSPELFEEHLDGIGIYDEFDLRESGVYSEEEIRHLETALRADPGLQAIREATQAEQRRIDTARNHPRVQKLQETNAGRRDAERAVEAILYPKKEAA